MSFPEVVTSGIHDVTAIRYTSALEASIAYDCGVGFFTCNWLRQFVDGLASFAKRKGRVRLIASPNYQAGSCPVTRFSNKMETDPRLLKMLDIEVDNLIPFANEPSVQLLSWMLAEDLLEIRLAVPAPEFTEALHPTIEIFSDQYGDFVIFHGLQNGVSHRQPNHVTLNAYTSWAGNRETARSVYYKNLFEQIWNQRDEQLNCLTLPVTIRDRLAQFTEVGEHQRQHQPAGQNEPAKRDKWNHQADAISAFMSRDSGVLEMATGTGKTHTALNILDQLIARDLISLVIVTMSGGDLLTQWYLALIKQFDLPVYRQFGTFRESSGFFACKTTRVLIISRQQLATVVSSLDTTDFKRGLLICDEVHGLGSPSMVRDLNGKLQQFGFRLGLSATPDREYDEAGNKFIEQEIGPVVFQYTLKDAIRNGVLCEFDYEPIEYSLSDEDRAAIRSAIKRHYARRQAGERASDEALYRDIAYVRKITEQKIAPFRTFLACNKNRLSRCLIFVETAAFGLKIQPLLMEARIPFHTYYQADDSKNLRRFANRELDCLISCHRLSEGIDIHSVSSIVLFSSSRPRLETIQRLGRCLRVDPLNPQKRSLVVDFVDFSEETSEQLEMQMSADLLRYEWFKDLSRTCHMTN